MSGASREGVHGARRGGGAECARTGRDADRSVSLEDSLPSCSLERRGIANTIINHLFSKAVPNIFLGKPKREETNRLTPDVQILHV